MIISVKDVSKNLFIDLFIKAADLADIKNTKSSTIRIRK